MLSRKRIQERTQSPEGKGLPFPLKSRGERGEKKGEEEVGIKGQRDGNRGVRKDQEWKAGEKRRMGIRVDVMCNQPSMPR